MKCSNSCRLFGACQALAGIKDSVILLHSVVGCHFGSLGFHISRDMSDMRQACTIINDRDIIFNGENSLKQALDHVSKLYNSRCITVVSGCVSQMIGDDVKAVICESGNGANGIHIDGAGFKSDFEKGYEDALLEFGKTFCKEAESYDAPAVNIMGMLYDDYKKEADIKEMKSLLGDKVRINCVTALCNLKDMENLSAAHLNIVFGRGSKLALLLKEKYGQPFIELDYPYGIEGMKRVLCTLGNFFNISFRSEIEILEKSVLKVFEKIYSYLQGFYGLPVCLYGSKARVEGMKNFLNDELGMEVVSIGVSSKEQSMEDFINSAVESDAALVFGSSFEADISDRLNVPLIQYDYPVFHRVSISDSPYIGANGTVYLVEDILNSIMNGPKSKKGFYR